MAQLHSYRVPTLLALLAIVPACSKRAPEPTPAPAIVIAEPTDSMFVSDGTIPPPRPVPPAAEPADVANPDAEEIFVIAGENGTWKAQYANGQRIVFGGNPRNMTPTERNAIGKLVLPVNKPVKFTCIAESGADVFGVPAFSLAIDVKAGRYTTGAVKPIRVGEFGFWHGSERVGSVKVVTAEEFRDFLAGIPSSEPAPVDGSLAHTGQQLFIRLQCVSCHSGNAKARAPALEGLYGTRVVLKGGATELADEHYLIESIRKPRLKVVDGWEAIMPAYDKEQATDDDLTALVAYIRSLKKSEKPKDDRFPVPIGPPKKP